MSRGTDLFYHFMRYCWCYPLGWAYFRISGSGDEHLPDEGPFILAANHVSHLDPWFLGRFVKRPVNWMATRLYYDRPFWRRWFYQVCGTIPVDMGRLDHSSARKALQVLRGGGVIGIFPEGERSWTGEIQEGNPGVAFLAARAGVPMIPAAVYGACESLPRGAPFPRPGRIRVRFGPPMEVSAEAGQRRDKAWFEEVTRDLMGRIADLHAQLVEEANPDLLTYPS